MPTRGRERKRLKFAPFAQATAARQRDKLAHSSCSSGSGRFSSCMCSVSAAALAAGCMHFVCGLRKFAAPSKARAQAATSNVSVPDTGVRAQLRSWPASLLRLLSPRPAEA